MRLRACGGPCSADIKKPVAMQRRSGGQRRHRRPWRDHRIIVDQTVEIGSHECGEHRQVSAAKFVGTRAGRPGKASTTARRASALLLPKIDLPWDSVKPIKKDRLAKHRSVFASRPQVRSLTPTSLENQDAS